MKILPMALYGTELANPPEEYLKKLAAAITMAIAGRHGGKTVVATYENNKIRGRDLDPVSLIASHRILQLRRILERKPEAEELVRELMEEYNKRAEQGTVDGNMGFFTEEAPHPNTQSRAKVMRENQPMGPIGLLIQTVHLIGGIINAELSILMQGEEPLDVRHTPFQCLAKLALAGATRARMKAEAKRVQKWRELAEVDQEVFEKAKKAMTKEDRNILRTIHNGGGYDKVKIWQRIDDETDIRCRYCGAGEQTTKHIVWECPCFAEQRKEEGGELAKGRLTKFHIAYCLAFLQQRNSKNVRHSGASRSQAMKERYCRRLGWRIRGR